MSNCERYRNDPETYADHAESCEVCREMKVELGKVDGSVSQLALDPKPEFRQKVTNQLPLAPWEGAKYRSWGLAIAVLITLVVLVAGAFLAVGISPVRAARALGSTMIPLVSPFELARSFAAVISTAPTKVHIAIGIAFLIVNVILYLLLRRPPKGYDA